MIDTSKILVTRGDLCQYLLDRNFRIVSVGRNKFNKNSTVFYFLNENNIQDEIKSFTIKNSPKNS